MDIRVAAAGLTALTALSACAGPSRTTATAGRSRAATVECAPYARQVSGLQLYGDAADWWEEAAGRYGRSAAPSPGAVLVFRRNGRLPHGHVSVVARLRSEREITVTQANWVHGRIAHDEPVVDVSPGNDWTAVRVWWAPSSTLGTTVYPAFGFIAGHPPRSDGIAGSGAGSGGTADTGVAGLRLASGACPLGSDTPG